jgi:hypothetical protein
MELRGIVLGTIVAVIARCAIWMPWYTLRVLRSQTPPPGGPPILLDPRGATVGTR